jgi:hypothetical protein
MDPNLLIVLLSTITVTAYQPIPAQTKPECRDRYHCQTSIDDNVTMYGCAISQDLLKSGKVKYGDVLNIPGFGLRVVNDVMGPTKCVKRNGNGRCTKRIPQSTAVDLMVFSYAEEHNVGIRHLPVTRYRQLRQQDMPGMRE